MTDPHGRYEHLAVGHVLGGLGTTEAADFRSHLLGCTACRRRVAELRDIAADLEAAERDEVERATVRTARRRRTDPTHDEPPQPHGPIAVRHVTAAAVVVLLMAGAMAFWNLHLRANVTLQSTVIDQHADALRELATGVVVDAEFGPGVDGLVVLDGEQVAFSLVGVEDVAARESLIAWLLDDEGQATAESTLLARTGELDDGLVRGVVDAVDAHELVVSREVGDVGAWPGGEPLLRVVLRPEG